MVPEAIIRALLLSPAKCCCLVTQAVNKSWFTLVGVSKKVRDDASHIAFLGAVGYKNWHALTMLAQCATRLGYNFDPRSRAERKE